VCCAFKYCDDSDLIKRVDKELAQITTGLTPTSPTIRFRVTNPSKKLSLTLHVYARPGNNGAAQNPGTHNYAGETWQLTAAVLDNPEVELNPAFVDSTGAAAPRALPDSYDVVDGVKLIHGQVSIVGSGQPTGDIYKIVAIWEPTDSTMTYEERLYWFKKCDLSVEGNALVTASNGT